MTDGGEPRPGSPRPPLSVVIPVCDEAESLCPPSLWTLASYAELLFLDTHPEGDLLL